MITRGVPFTSTVCLLPVGTLDILFRGGGGGGGVRVVIGFYFVLFSYVLCLVFV